MNRHVGESSPSTPSGNMAGYLYLTAFVACVPLANWLIANVGTVCVQGGPCLVPVWPGIEAPSGVLVAGAAFVLRDLVQHRLGLRWSVIGVLFGGVIAAFVAPAALAVASVTAFVLSELVDTMIFTPLRKRGLIVAVAASSIVGVLLDSVIFVWLAFGEPQYILGQAIGKGWMVILGLTLLVMIGTTRNGTSLPADVP